MASNTESNKDIDHVDDDNDESIQDEQVRRDIKILSARLYDLRERFMKIIDKIKRDCDDENCNEDDSSVANVDKPHNQAESNDKISQESIESILEGKKRCYKYMKHVIKYPQIMNYLVDDDPNCTNIPFHYLEPFIKEYVNQNPSEETFNEVSQQMQDIRRKYLQHRTNI